MKQKQLDCCSHCQSEEGYYIKTQIRGTTQSRYNFDGSFHDEDNADIHDYLIYKDGKWAYCRKCNKRLFEVSY